MGLFGKSKKEREISPYAGLCDLEGACGRRCLRKHVLGWSHGCEDNISSRKVETISNPNIGRYPYNMKN